jgi:hypothetical protein
MGKCWSGTGLNRCRQASLVEAMQYAGNACFRSGIPLNYFVSMKRCSF